MIGASATSGFTMKEPLGGTNTQFLRLNRYIDAAITGQHRQATNFASALFFTQPVKTGESQLTRALNEKPTLVVAVDFLFWFCYGKVSNDVERASRFEEGLRLLERIPCPVVIGDLPDASGAVGKILSAEEVPGTDALAAANARLSAWVTQRTNVYVVPLANFMRAAVHDEAIVAKHYSLSAGTTRRLLQADGLHPTSAGCSALALNILEAVESKHDISKDVKWDCQSIEQSVVEAVRAAQAAAATNNTATKVIEAAQPSTPNAAPVL